MCKAHVLMQPSPFRWEESKPIALFFYSSLVQREYTFPRIIYLFEALREMFSITILFSQRCLLFLCNCVHLLFPWNLFFFWEANVFLNDACFKTWFKMPLCCPWIANDSYKYLVFTTFIYFTFKMKSWAWYKGLFWFCTFSFSLFS